MSSVPLRLVSAHLTACRRRTTAGLALVLVLLAAGCREGEGVRVDALDFEGNAHFSGSTLADVFATRDTGPLPWSRVRYFDRATFDADVDRLRAFYRDRGYPDASVTVDVQFNDARDAVRLRVAVAEGEPTLSSARLLLRTMPYSRAMSGVSWSVFSALK
jgi:outer membrane protein insertion porin family